ncbi:hypothetical protein niasHT_011713 [Heterodera trifolii]|uniref:ANK_REP_REGION domain-containing protein n=1 Tax=Heterodera trifolii TaxID=157864 RepID=A0ABD2KXM3_9BILA
MLNELFGIVHSFRSHLNKHFLECVLVGKVPKNWSDNSFFALFGAALNGQIETLKILSESNDVNLRIGQLETAGGTFDGVSLLWIASAAGHLEIVKFVHQKGDDVNGNGSVIFADGKIINDISPLCAATCAGHLKVCEFLVENNANINHRMDIGFTPLDCAYIRRQFEIAKFLRENGAEATIEQQFQFCTEGTLAVPPLISGTVN